MSFFCSDKILKNHINTQMPLKHTMQNTVKTKRIKPRQNQNRHKNSSINQIDFNPKSTYYKVNN